MPIENSPKTTPDADVTSAPKSESENTFVRVGKMKDAHGIRGELFVVLFAGEADWLPKLKTLRLVKEDTGAVIKDYSIKSARVHKNGLIVKTGEIKDRNEAETLKGLLVEVPESFLTSKKGEQIYLREILGFEVSNGDEVIGKITKFSSNTAQDLLVVTTAKGEFEIPFVDAFVEKINYESKRIRMKLPFGLLGEDPVRKEERDGQNDHLADTDADTDTDADSEPETGAN